MTKMNFTTVELFSLFGKNQRLFLCITIRLCRAAAKKSQEKVVEVRGCFMTRKKNSRKS